MEKLIFEDIAIPESLDSMVDDLLGRLPVKKRWILRRGVEALASFAGLIFILSILIYSNDTFADMAMDIPGLKLIAKWIHHDDGVNHAVDNGYPILGPFVYQDGDYELVLSNIMIDEKRITFDSVLSGPHFDGKRVLGPVPFLEFYQMVRFRYSFSLEGCNRLGKSPEGPIKGAQSNSILLPEANENYIMELLDAGNPLPLKMTIVRDTAHEHETIYTMENVEIPFNREDVLLTRKYELDDSLVTPHGVIQFKTLKIAPTCMELDYEVEPNGVNGFGLSEYRLLDSDGMDLLESIRTKLLQFVTTFGSEKGVSEKKVRTYEIPASLYFDEPESLTVAYDSYYYTLQVESEPYTLDLNDEFPKVYDYHGYTFIVDGVQRLKYNLLEVQFHVENGAGIDIQSVQLEGLEHNSFMISNELNGEQEKITSIFVEKEKKDAYTMRLGYPKIIVEKKGKVELQLR